MKTEIISIFHPEALQIALEIIRDGGLIAFPTDTVYGLGADAFNDLAVNTIYIAKGRSIEKAIPLLIGDLDQLSLVSRKVNFKSEKIASHFWPGPLTIIFPKQISIPISVTPYETVGVRIPDLQCTKDILKFTGPLAVTSANISGMSSPTNARDVFNQLNGRIPLILDGGPTPGGIPSTVVDCSGDEPIILREGPISLLEIKNFLS
ncbi:MAG: L-threonylcarbamoyladenylate synthase [Chloroflexota bacterium]